MSKPFKAEVSTVGELISILSSVPPSTLLSDLDGAEILNVVYGPLPGEDDVMCVALLAEPEDDYDFGEDEDYD